MSVQVTHVASGVVVSVSEEKAERLGHGWSAVEAAKPAPRTSKKSEDK